MVRGFRGLKDQPRPWPACACWAFSKVATDRRPEQDGAHEQTTGEHFGATAEGGRSRFNGTSLMTKTPGQPIEATVTPEMVEAGFRVLSTSGLMDEYLEADKLLVAEIYQAMARAEHRDGRHPDAG